MTMRIGVMLSVVLALCAPSVARAGSGYLQNDAFSGTGTIDSSANFESYNGAAVFLSSPDGGYPLTLTGIAVLYVPQSGPASQEAYELEIFDTPDGGLPTAAYGDLYSDHLSGTTVSFNTSTSAFNVFNLPTPIVLDGTIFVRLKQNYSCSLDGVCYSGTIATDAHPPVPGANWFYKNYGGYQDMSLPDSGYPYGNWIIRGVIDVPDVDAGSGTTTSTSTSGTTTTSTGTSTGTTGSGSTGTSTTGGTTSTTSTSGSMGSTTTGGTGTTGAGTTSSGGTTGGGSTTGAAAPTLTSVSPTSAFTGDDTQVTLIGSNFQFGIQAVIGPSTLSNPDLKSPALLQGTLQHGTAPGTYDVTIVNPDGQQATLHNAFTVQAGSGGSGSSGATTAGGTNGAKTGGCGCASTSDAFLFGLPVLLLGLRRRRR